MAIEPRGQKRMVKLAMRLPLLGRDAFRNRETMPTLMRGARQEMRFRSSLWTCESGHGRCRPARAGSFSNCSRRPNAISFCHDRTLTDQNKVGVVG